MYFNSSISQVMTKNIEHLSDFVFIFMANLTLTRNDAYLLHLRFGIKPNNLAALRTTPLQLTTLFPDSVTKRAEDDIAARDIHCLTRRVVLTLTNITIESQTATNLKSPPGKTLVHIVRAREARGSRLTTHPDWPRAHRYINDNYCVNVLETGLLTDSQETVKCVQLPETLSLKTMDIQTPQTSNVNCSIIIVNLAHIAERH